MTSPADNRVILAAGVVDAAVDILASWFIGILFTALTHTDGHVNTSEHHQIISTRDRLIFYQPHNITLIKELSCGEFAASFTITAECHRSIYNCFYYTITLYTGVEKILFL